MMAQYTSHHEKPWQNSLLGSKNKLNALFNEGRISDLTIAFPGKEVKYKAHKVILGMSSTVFEQMLFGPMAITGSELELPDDDSEAFRIVLAHCYEVNIKPVDMEKALEVYLLADKYFLDELKEVCSHYIRSMIDSDNIDKVLEFSTNFNFGSLRKTCFKHVKDSPQFSIFFIQEYLPEFLESNEKLEELVIVDSWKNPDKILDEDSMLQVIRSKNCTNPGLNIFSGCVSAEVVKNICWNKFQNVYHELKLSFINYQQANEIFRLLNEIKDITHFDICIPYFHFQSKGIPAERLGRLPKLNRRPRIFISNVSDDGIDWVISALFSLKPDSGTFELICFPKSDLTLSGLKILLKRIANVFRKYEQPGIYVSSSNIPLEKQQKLNARVCKRRKDGMIDLQLFEKSERMYHW